MTPFELHLTPGEHRAAVRDDRYADQELAVRVPAGRPFVIRLEAVPRTGSVVIVTDRKRFGATQIAIDNQPLALTEGETLARRTAPRQLVVGPHSLVCTLPRRPSFYVEFTVEQARDTEVLCAFATVAPQAGGPDVLGWVTVGTGAALAAAGTGVLISWALDVAHEEELNGDADPSNDVSLETSKHIVGGVLLGVGVAVGVASWFVFHRNDAVDEDAASPTRGALGILPVRGGALATGSLRF